MGRYLYNRHPFDMKEYLAGERFVIGGLDCDWERDEPEIPNAPVVKEQELKNKPEKKLNNNFPKRSLPSAS